MSDDLGKTIRFRRDVVADGKRADPQTSTETAEFELVSTQMLEQVLRADDNAPKDQIRELAEVSDGWLAQDTGDQHFEIVKDNEVEAALLSANRGNDSPSTPNASLESIHASAEDTANDLCLVSTQHLRKVLNVEPEEQPKAENPAIELRGFNPYDNG